MRWENDRQFGGGGSSQGDTIKTVTNINLVEVDWAVTGVSMSNTVQQPFQGTTELHGFMGCQFDSVSVDAIKGQIHDETGVAVALGDAAKGGDAKAAKMFESRQTTEFADSVIRKNRPETFLGEVGHFVADEVDMVMGRFMRTALEAGVNVCVGPAGGAGHDRHAMITEGDEEAGGRMGKVFQVGGEVAGTTCRGDVGGPIGRGTQGLQGRMHNLT
jgi:hypothetical protein